MEISTTSTEDLEQHYKHILTEQAHRRDTGTPGDHEYLKDMNDETLRSHQLYVVRELFRRDAKARHHAFFTTNTK